MRHCLESTTSMESFVSKLVLTVLISILGTLDFVCIISSSDVSVEGSNILMLIFCLSEAFFKRVNAPISIWRLRAFVDENRILISFLADFTMSNRELLNQQDSVLFQSLQ